MQKRVKYSDVNAEGEELDIAASETSTSSEGYSVYQNWNITGILLVNVFWNSNNLPGLVFILLDFPAIVQ